MTAKGVPLWEVRDDRTLSAYAKLAYLMLWSRLPECRPSHQRLADDMGVSRATAKRAVRELEGAGLLKRIPCENERGDNDPNIYHLTRVTGTLPPGQSDPRGRSSQTPEDSNHKTSRKGPNKSAGLPAGSRVPRERPKIEDSDIIAAIRSAVDEYYGEPDLDFEDVKALYLGYAHDRRDKIVNWHAYFMGVFENGNGAPLESHLSKAA